MSFRSTEQQRLNPQADPTLTERADRPSPLPSDGPKHFAMGTYSRQGPQVTVTESVTQLRAMASTIGNNARPLQPLNGHLVLVLFSKIYLATKSFSTLPTALRCLAGAS